jgi:RNA polymerase sigma-70 factor (ECF subfamily)
MPDTTPDRRAWMRALLDQYEGRLVRYAAGLLGDADAARDAVQDTFLRLCAQDPEAVRGHEAAWLFHVCRNRCLDLNKKEGRMTELTEVDMERRPSADPPPANLAERNESARRVLALLGALPARQREVVRLKFQEGLSYKEIARITRLSEGNVGMVLHTALKQLRTQLQLSA